MRGMHVASVLLLLSIAISILPVVPAQTQDPFYFYGTIYQANSQPAPNAAVVIRNLRTNEIISVYADASGYYQNTTLNWPSGYVRGDNVLFIATLGTQSGETTVQIPTGNTPGMQVDIRMVQVTNVFNLTVKVYAKKNSLPIKDATVRVSTYTLATDANGIAVVALASGTYTVTVSASSYQSQSKSATIAGAPFTVIFYLEEVGAVVAPAVLPTETILLILVVIFIIIVLIMLSSKADRGGVKRR